MFVRNVHVQNVLCENGGMCKVCIYQVEKNKNMPFPDGEMMFIIIKYSCFVCLKLSRWGRVCSIVRLYGFRCRKLKIGPDCPRQKQGCQIWAHAVDFDLHFLINL